MRYTIEFGPGWIHSVEAPTLRAAAAAARAIGQSGEPVSVTDGDGRRIPYEALEGAL